MPKPRTSHPPLQPTSIKKSKSSNKTHKPPRNCYHNVATKTVKTTDLIAFTKHTNLNKFHKRLRLQNPELNSTVAKTIKRWKVPMERERERERYKLTTVNYYQQGCKFFRFNTQNVAYVQFFGVLEQHFKSFSTLNMSAFQQGRLYLRCNCLRPQMKQDPSI